MDSSDSTLASGKVTERGRWSRQIEFFLSLLGYSVGIGSMVRYPYLCFKNGGGAFVIPFFLSYFVCGIPLFMLELLLGQFSGLSPSTLWNCCPILKGIGYSMAAISAIVSLYYNMLIAYCLFYLFASFTHQVPWQECGNWWNTDRCWDGRANSTRLFSNYSSNATNTTGNFVWASEEYWQNRVLGLSSSVEDVGSFRGELVLCALGGWLFTFFSLAWGVKGTGKVVYVTATLPYVFLVALVVRGCTLEGAWTGLSMYFLPDFSKLLDPSTWIQGFLQMFYSLGPAWGGLITISSYNKFSHNCNREGYTIPFFDMSTAVFAGVAVFSILGFMSHQTGVPVEDVARAGPGLTFVAYPLALANLPAAQVWSAIFFLTVINLGLDSQFGMFETVLSGLFDAWPPLRKHHTVVVGVSSALFFLIGLIFCTEGGNYYYHLFDWYGATFTVPLVAVLEVLAVTVIYGIDNFSEDVRLMLGKPPSALLKCLWFISMPITFVIFLVGIIFLAPPTYGTYAYPPYVHYVGIFVISLSTTLPLPITAVLVFLRAKPDEYPPDFPDRLINRGWFHFVTRLRNASQPNDDWLPQDPAAQLEYRELIRLRKLRRSRGGKANETQPSQPFLAKA